MQQVYRGTNAILILSQGCGVIDRLWGRGDSVFRINEEQPKEKQLMLRVCFDPAIV